MNHTSSNPTGPAGVAIIGAGNISDQYLTNLTSYPDVTVRYVADLDPARAREQAEKYGIEGHGAPDGALTDDGTEIVVNLTVPAVHAEVDLAAAAAGKHIWTEKPLALDADSGRAVLEAASKAGVRVACAPDTFLGKGLQSALRFVAEGGIGTPLAANTTLQNSGPDVWHPNPDFFFAPGAGPLFDMGPYYLTTLVQFLGPIARVHAVTSRPRSERHIGAGPRAGEGFPVDVETYVAALYEFESGQVAHSTFSFDSALGRVQFEVTGTDATLTVPDPNTFDGELVITKACGEIDTIATEGSERGRGAGVVELARAIRAGVPERASGDLSLHVLDVMQSTLEAGATGQPVDVASTVEPAQILPDGWDPAEATL